MPDPVITGQQPPPKPDTPPEEPFPLVDREAETARTGRPAIPPPPLVPPSAVSLRELVDTLNATRAALVGHGQLLQAQTAPVGPSVESGPPPSKLRQAAGVGGKTVQWLGVATLGVTLALQLATMFRPGLVGPLQHVLDLLGRLAQ